MGFQVSFTQQKLYSLLKKKIKVGDEEFKANALLFQPIFDKGGKTISNIEVWAMFHDPSNNLHVVLGEDFSNKLMRNYKKLPAPSLSGFAGKVTDENFNDIDEKVNSLHLKSYEQNAQNPLLKYDLVLFSEAQIPQVFKDDDYGNHNGSATKWLRLEHTLFDLGRITGRGGMKCRSCINLVAKGTEQPNVDVVMDYPWGGNDAMSIQFGHPCPPDWWTRAVELPAKTL